MDDSAVAHTVSSPSNITNENGKRDSLAFPNHERAEEGSASGARDKDGSAASGTLTETSTPDASD